MKSLNLLITMLFIFFLLTSCSKNSNPTAPDQPQQNGSDANPLVVADSQLPVNPYRGVFGAWKVEIDPEKLTAEIVPARNANAIGDIFDADLLQFLTVSPCANCLRITNVYIGQDYCLNIDVGIKHPFNDIVARPDLHGFDVRLIFILDGYWTPFSDIKVMQPGGAEEDALIGLHSLLNADGFTSHFDSIVTDERYFLNGTDFLGNLNPFIRYFNKYTTDTFDPHAPTGHNVMQVGSPFEVRTAQLAGWGLGGLVLYLVADVAYGHSATYLNRPDPQYYLPEYNRTEPWRTEYWIENNNLDAADPLSTADVMIQVFDWQQGATVDPDYPNPDNLSGISQSSNVSQLILSIPGLQNAPIIVDTPESGTGTPMDPLTYRLQVTNENGINHNPTGLLAVRDELYGQTGRLPIPESPSGFPYDTEDILDYTFYQIININNPSCWDNSYDGELFLYDDDLYARYGNTTIHADFFMDPGGLRFQYRWDYDYDGVTFDVDGGGNPSPEIEFNTGGKHNVGLRIRTNSKPAQEYIYTIPVISSDDIFQTDLDSTVLDMKDNSSVNRAAAIGWSSDYYYCAFSSEAGTRRDIWLVVGNSEGVFTSNCITATMSEDCFHPSIQVIENGVNDRVVVVFNTMNGTNWDLYSTWGNLDGSNFLPSHITQIATTTDYSSFVDTIYQYGKIFAYCWIWDLMSPNQNLQIVYSEDYGESWTVHPTLVDSGSARKYEPTVVYNEPNFRTFLIWEDFRNGATTGTDIYMAESYGGLDFDPPLNLTNFSGNVDEKHPEAVSKGSKIAIAYLADPENTGDDHVYVKLFDVYQQASIDFWVDYCSYGVHCLKPSIGMAVDNKMVLAYCTYNSTTEELKSIVAEVEAQDGFFDLRNNTIYNESVGTIPPAALPYYPGSAVICRSHIDDKAYETFAVWTGYNNGYALDNTPFPMYLGDIECIASIRDGE